MQCHNSLDVSQESGSKATAHLNSKPFLAARRHISRTKASDSKQWLKEASQPCCECCVSMFAACQEATHQFTDFLLQVGESLKLPRLFVGLPKAFGRLPRLFDKGSERAGEGTADSGEESDRAGGGTEDTGKGTADSAIRGWPTPDHGGVGVDGMLERQLGKDTKHQFGDWYGVPAGSLHHGLCTYVQGQTNAAKSH